MKKLQYSVYKQETGSAGGKAKNDAFDIFQKCDFLPSYKPFNVRFLRVIQQILSLRKIKKADVLVVQYPAISAPLMAKLQKKLRKAKTVSVALVHDLPSIQGMGGEAEKEIEVLNCFDYLIVHNSKMQAYLKDLGYNGKMVSLDIFDYLHDVLREIPNKEYSSSICIAGNLDKGAYIRDLGAISSYKFNLYGVNKVLDFSDVINATYLGCVPSDEIVYSLDGDYGLVWDGDSLDECSGIYGKYLLYNNPHKLSLYLSAGKPVIVWKKSAVASFVEENNVGIAVDSLRDLESIDLKSRYLDLKENVMAIKEKLGTGYYLTRAINKVLSEIKK